MTTPAPAGPVCLRHTAEHSPAALDLLDRAARFDAEMGFGPPHRHRLSGTTTVVEIDTCLHRHGVDHDDASVLAGVLTIRDRGNGVGTAALVVDPCRRAIGVATAVLEDLAACPEPERGWAGTGLHTLHAVAYGSHPAAERLARRSGVATAGVRHHLVLPAGERTSPGTATPTRIHDGGPGGEPDGAADDGQAVRLVFEEGTARVRRPGPDEPAEISAVAAAPGTPGDERCSAIATVAASAVGWLLGHGAGDVEAIADAGDEPLLVALRRVRFEHDRSDLVFRARRSR